MKKYELTGEIKICLGKKLYRIKALIDFKSVKAGELGGWIEKEENLSHRDNAWVCDNACVYGNAWVYGNACVCDDAHVYGNAHVYGDARVYDDARVCGNAWVYGNACVYGNAWVYGNACVCDDAHVCGDACVYGDACVCGNADYTTIKGFGSVYRTTTFFRCKDKSVKVACGCFFGTIAEFKEKVKQTHGDSKIAKEYLMIADLMEYHFAE